MIALIPVSRFRVTYDVASGRPYGKLESLVLKGVDEGLGNTESLVGAFRVHPRLITEALVTLIQAGWVSLAGSGEATLLLTAEGKGALAKGGLPISTSIAIGLNTTLVMERLTGIVIPNSEVRFHNRRELQSLWDHSIKIKERVFDNVLDEAQVQFLLPLRQGERLRWIGPIDMVSRGNHWVLVEVDLENSTVAWLPNGWVPALTEPVLAEAKRWSDQHGIPAPDLSTLPEGGSAHPTSVVHAVDADLPTLGHGIFELSLTRQDVLLRPSLHDQYLRMALSEATSSIIVASAYMELPALERVEEQLRNALSRGVSVDLLWGLTAEGDQRREGALGWLRRMAQKCQEDGLPGHLRFNSTPSRSGAKLLVWDRQHTYEAVVGSYDWLSASPVDNEDARTNEISLRVLHPALVSAICRCVAAICSGIPGEHLSSLPNRWRRVAASLEDEEIQGDRPTLSGINCRASMILDRQHENFLREALATASGRLLIASRDLGPNAVNRLGSATSHGWRQNIQLALLYGETNLDAADLAELRRIVDNVRGELRASQGMHANVLVVDDRAVVGSYRFLADEPITTPVRRRDVSLVVSGEPVEWAWEAIMSSVAP